MNGTATTCSSATETRCSAPTSSTTAATRPWGPPGVTSTSRRSAVRRLGRIRQKVIRRPRLTSGGTGTTTTTPRPRLARSGSRCPTLEKLPFESPTLANKAQAANASTRLDLSFCFSCFEIAVIQNRPAAVQKENGHEHYEQDSF